MQNSAVLFRSVEHNVFDVDLSDPWRHKWVPDPGRIPARKTSVSGGDGGRGAASGTGREVAGAGAQAAILAV